MKEVHRIITYVIDDVDEINQIVKDCPDGWEVHNRSDVYQNFDNEFQVDIFYRLSEK